MNKVIKTNLFLLIVFQLFGFNLQSSNYSGQLPEELVGGEMKRRKGKNPFLKSLNDRRDFILLPEIKKSGNLGVFLEEMMRGYESDISDKYGVDDVFFSRAEFSLTGIYLQVHYCNLLASYLRAYKDRAKQLNKALKVFKTKLNLALDKEAIAKLDKIDYSFLVKDSTVSQFMFDCFPGACRLSDLSISDYALYEVLQKSEDLELRNLGLFFAECYKVKSIELFIEDILSELEPLVYKHVFVRDKQKETYFFQYPSFKDFLNAILAHLFDIGKVQFEYSKMHDFDRVFPDLNNEQEVDEPYINALVVLIDEYEKDKPYLVKLYEAFFSYMAKKFSSVISESKLLVAVEFESARCNDDMVFEQITLPEVVTGLGELDLSDCSINLSVNSEAKTYIKKLDKDLKDRRKSEKLHQKNLEREARKKAQQEKLSRFRVDDDLEEELDELMIGDVGSFGGETNVSSGFLRSIHTPDLMTATPISARSSVFSSRPCSQDGVRSKGLFFQIEDQENDMTILLYRVKDMERCRDFSKVKKTLSDSLWCRIKACIAKLMPKQEVGTIYYADRVLDWIESPEDKIADGQGKDVGYSFWHFNSDYKSKIHRFSLAVDEKLNELGLETYYKNDRTGQTYKSISIPATIICNIDGEQIKEYGFFDYAFGEDGICFHRCFSALSEKSEDLYRLKKDLITVLHAQALSKLKL